MTEPTDGATPPIAPGADGPPSSDARPAPGALAPAPRPGPRAEQAPAAQTPDEAVAQTPDEAEEPVGDTPVPDAEQAAAPPPVPQPPRPTPRPPQRGADRPAPEGRPAPRPHPVPSALPRPTAPSAHDAVEAAQAAAWGRVDQDGTVWVREAAGERSVGQYPGADSSEALAFYVRRFLDLQAQVTLLEARISIVGVKELDATLATLRQALVAPAAVGDIDGLRTRLEVLEADAETRRAEAAAQREAAKAEALTSRTALVETAERIAQTDPARMQWRQAGDQLKELLEEWKHAQRHGPRLDRAAEDALWKRFSHARSTFDRGRRQYFVELERRRQGARAAKEEIVAEAEQLAGSTDWSGTAATFRRLMDRWKAAGRAAQADDDALWNRFRAAQDAFFSARNAAVNATDAEMTGNLQVKLGLLAEAEALLPISDLGQVRAALRAIQDRWDAAGKVPRGEVQRVEARLRAVEQAVRDAQQSAWARSNPETRARAEGAAAQLEAAIQSLEEDLAAAKAARDRSAVKDLETALAARRAWLATVRRTANDA